MNRRNLLIAGGGTLGAVAGGTAVARATRADVLADAELTQGKGEPVAIERTITRESVTYLASTNTVNDTGHTQPFNQWARRECADIAASNIVRIADTRLDTAVEGVGSGVRHLLFGPVITLDRTVTRDRDGTVVSEPNVSLDRLISAAPRTVTVTVTLAGETLTKTFPVGVGDSEVSMD